MLCIGAVEVSRYTKKRSRLACGGGWKGATSAKRRNGLARTGLAPSAGGEPCGHGSQWRVRRTCMECSGRSIPAAVSPLPTLSGVTGQEDYLKDGERMGELLQHALRRGSFVPLSVARLNPLASQLGTSARTGFPPDPKTVGSSDGVRRTGLGGGHV
jgi:hypothetical protein